MGKRSEFPGVEARPGGIRVFFRYQNRLCREPLRLPVTPANIKHAARLVATINAQVRAGIFDYAATFPDSVTATNGGVTVKDYVESYKRLQTHLAPSTLKSYTSALRLLDRFANCHPREVTASKLGMAILDHGFRSVKGRNNCISPLRGVFDLMVNDNIIASNPADALKYAKVQKGEPDPLTMEEVEDLLTWFRTNRSPQTLNYFEFAIFTGMRTSELLGLQWGDIDFRRGTAKVHRVVVNGEDKHTTKTARSRNVELMSRAIAALKRQKDHTFLTGGRIFDDPLTGKPYVDDKAPRLQWNAALKSLGMRERVAYQTRHTWVTMALMAGANPVWVAAQAGHSVQMTLQTYGKWISGADKGREMAKLESSSGEHLGNIRGNSGSN